MKKYTAFFRKETIAVLAALILPLVSCQQNALELKPVDISGIYGYTFYGNITASKGETLKPSLILYNEKRAAWNMSIKWGEDAVQCYYYAVRNSVNNYTLYWFGPADEDAANNHDASKAIVVLQLGINSLNEIVVLRTDNNFMSGTRVPMQKQTNIAHNGTPPPMP